MPSDWFESYQNFHEGECTLRIWFDGINKRVWSGFDETEENYYQKGRFIPEDQTRQFWLIGKDYELELLED